MTILKRSGMFFLLANLLSQMTLASPMPPAAKDPFSPAGNQTPSAANVDQFTPSTSGEKAFIQDSQTRLNNLYEQDRKMIENDRQMMKEGYDPNEIPPQYKTPGKDQKQQPHWYPPSGQVGSYE